MENDPSPTQPNDSDELEFTELTGINDYDLDQKLRLPGRIQNLREDSDIIGVSEIVLMLLAQPLPAQLEYRSNCTSELKDAAYERLLNLMREAIQSRGYSKLRRLSMPLATVTWS